MYMSRTITRIVDNEDAEADMYGASHMSGLEWKMSTSSKSSYNGSKSTSDWNSKKQFKEPKNIVFKETAAKQDERIRKNSPYGKLQTWKLARFIVKTGDDLRQEQFTMQLIS